MIGVDSRAGASAGFPEQTVQVVTACGPRVEDVNGNRIVANDLLPRNQLPETLWNVAQLVESTTLDAGSEPWADNSRAGVVRTTFDW